MPLNSPPLQCPSPVLSPPVTTGFFSGSVSLLLFVTFISLLCFSTYKRQHTVPVFPLTDCAPRLSVLLQMARFRSFLWPSRIPLYLYGFILVYLLYPSNRAMMLQVLLSLDPRSHASFYLKRPPHSCMPGLYPAEPPQSNC